MCNALGTSFKRYAVLLHTCCQLIFSILTFGTCFAVVKRGDVPLDAGYVKFVGDVLCHLMEAYPQCLWKSKVVVHKSVIAVFAALSKWTVIDSLIDRFVVHTLMLSISNVTDPDQAVRINYAREVRLIGKCPDCSRFAYVQQVIYHPDTGELVTNLLYDYEGFWLALLRRRTKTLADSPIKASTCSDDVDMKEPMNAGRTLQAILFDSTVKSVAGIVSQLNLSYQFDLQTTNNGKNANGYTVSSAKLRCLYDLTNCAFVDP